MHYTAFKAYYDCTGSLFLSHPHSCSLPARSLIGRNVMTEPAAYARVIEDRFFSHQQSLGVRAIPILILFSNTA